MYFEAKLNNKNYKVQVNELPLAWKISLQEESKPWIHYDISKNEYKRAESYISFLFKNVSYLIDVVGAGTEYTIFTRSSARTVSIYNDEMILHESLKSGSAMGGGTELKSGMPGKIIQIFVKPGQEVPANKPLLIMEAMKMENEMRSVGPVKIKEIKVKQGDSVESGAVLITFEKN